VVAEESGQDQSGEGEGERGKRGDGSDPVGGAEQVLPGAAVSVPERLRPGSEKKEVSSGNQRRSTVSEPKKLKLARLGPRWDQKGVTGGGACLRGSGTRFVPVLA
jgi:hypothetical protein